MLFDAPLAPGTPAPDFELPDDQGGLVRLSALRGQNVVLVFYPADETPVCRQQLCEFRDRAELALQKHAAVFGLNPGSPGSHAGFRERQRLGFPLLVDRGGKVAKAYNAKSLWIRRTVYLIGKDGVIRYAKRGKPAVEEVLAAAD
ncbi:MAG: peroxiredoxin [Bryobacteraceae bacterium]